MAIMHELLTGERRRLGVALADAGVRAARIGLRAELRRLFPAGICRQKRVPIDQGSVKEQGFACSQVIWGMSDSF
jgi:hypothetical protein